LAQLDQALVVVLAGDGAGSLLYLRAIQRLPDPLAKVVRYPPDLRLYGSTAVSVAP
jgi:hypothetical protein